MRVSLPVSLVAHGTLIVLGVLGLHSTSSLEPQQVESISVDLVPVDSQSNIRVGSEKSDVIKTDTPSVVDTNKQAKLAEPTGNTKRDQPKPLDSPKPTPAPTVQSAPEPSPQPAPQPEPKPTAAPKPEPTPKPDKQTETPKPSKPKPPNPAPAPEPVLTSQPSEQAPPQPVAPAPAVAPSSLAQRRAEFQKQQEAETKQAKLQKRQESPQAKKADKISDIINTEKSRGATTGQGGQQTAGKTTGTAQRLTQSERDALVRQMKACWTPPLAAMNTPGLTVQLMVDLNQDGSVAGTPQIVSQVTTQLEDTTARAAQRAVMRCGPYKLAPEKYAEWKRIDVTFDPHDLP